MLRPSVGSLSLSHKAHTSLAHLSIIFVIMFPSLSVSKYWSDHIKHDEVGGARGVWHVTYGMYVGTIYIHEALFGKPEGKIQLRGPNGRWEEYVKTDFKWIGWRSME
jgi:hypothetical protein